MKQNLLKTESGGLAAGISGAIKLGVSPVTVTGASGPERAYLVAREAFASGRPFFVFLPTEKEAKTFLADISFFAGNKELPVFFFPSYQALSFKRMAYHNEIAANRVKILYRLAVAGHFPAIYVASVETLIQRVIPKQVLCDSAELLMINEDIDFQGLIGRLHASGYTHASIVEEPGDYTVRGGILDVFSPMYDDPIRIELFGDMVESIRLFSSVTQRKLSLLDEAVILPARESVVKKDGITSIIERVRRQAAQAGIPRRVADEFEEKIRTTGMFEGMESLLPLVYPETGIFFDYLPESAAIVLVNPGELEFQANKKNEAETKNYIQACADHRLCVPPESVYLCFDDVKSRLCGYFLINFQLVSFTATGEDGDAANNIVNLSIEDNSDICAELAGPLSSESTLLPLVKWIKRHLQNKYNTVLVCRTPFQADRLTALLEPYGIKIISKSGFASRSGKSGAALICTGDLSAGFVWHDKALALITEDEMFGKKGGRPPRIRKQGTLPAARLDFSGLKTGDLVVHLDHGIGQYQGLEKIRVEGIVNDFLVIGYRDNDRLYLPVDRMDMIQKYMGVDGIPPIVDRLGGVSWKRIKAKAEKSVEKIAGELLDLYAKRRVKKGYAFSPPDASFHDFEAGFPYDETSDQLSAIDDVLDDMESETPMDRLICGDVGYGKTEIALRASFKAVSDGKQVAILVPTTLLAEQHFRTFIDRFSKYPVFIESLSRFKTAKQQRETVADIKAGKVDIVIGTHRLLQKDIGFKDLGLIVLDEEQRFGVRHKEKLKTMRATVDALSMTATPIPRTLHMSLMGVRDISLISTPPALRQPIVSYLSEFDTAVISDAVKKEMARAGQIFFIHNNIHTIWNMSKRLLELVPDCRIGVAHGRLNEKELEKVMRQFIDHKIDMLVCTTIVESGLDIPNANTMIINRADRFGLAQIYQLRGRVGRSGEQAYAYLMVDRETALTKDAQKRLKVIMEHSDLGAGFQIALNDLKIRGGGAALGISQSGHIAAVGYDMFLRLMEDAVARLKGQRVVPPLEPEINIPVSVFIPEDYIPDLDQRMSAYRRLSKFSDLKSLADFRDELIDRYGRMPQEAVNLVLKIMLRVLCIKAGAGRLDLTFETLVLTFSELHQKNPPGAVDFIMSDPKRFSFTPQQALRAVLKKGSINSLMSQVKKILMEIVDYVN
ncbi:MAG: transcription-repair coupling factor [Deltaproteobacteria bacterium]|nr:transcription-repair coupling factor [Deltaproteobacteria bacterium]